MVYVNLLYKFSVLTISLLDTAKRILYNSCVIRENKAVKSMKAKTDFDIIIGGDTMSYRLYRVTKAHNNCG